MNVWTEPIYENCSNNDATIHSAKSATSLTQQPIFLTNNSWYYLISDIFHWGSNNKYDSQVWIMKLTSFQEFDKCRFFSMIVF